MLILFSKAFQILPLYSIIRRYMCSKKLLPITKTLEVTTIKKPQQPKLPGLPTKLKSGLIKPVYQQHRPWFNGVCCLL